MDRSEAIYLNHRGLIRETPMALLFQLQEKQVWLPKSQVIDYDDGVVAIPLWLAEDKDLESDW